MLKDKRVIFHIKRKTMRNIYLDMKEFDDLILNLSPTEQRLYSLLLNSILLNPAPDYFTTPNLATQLQISIGTLKNARANLTNKGYILIKKFKDETGETTVRVVVGKEQVELYNLGLKVEIQDAKAYRKLVKEFDFIDPTLSLEERKDRVKKANTAYATNPQEYN